ncbi:hypothetical protein XENOCAPTIV_016806 [Xenoophorus captivus]|uniref:Pre-mRNA-splicing factor SLU7 n=1 Tax=Xenoophorus captivus TaxID=1517983 RepID=A0ABV0Q634_9TELE
MNIQMSFVFPQRPRKVGAKFTGTEIAPDEHSQVQLALDYDGKRDRWNGYDPEEHQRIVEEYAKVDLEREYDSEDEDEDKYADDIDMPGQNFDSKRRITVRNLRIREDTAKVRGRRTDRELIFAVQRWLSLLIMSILKELKPVMISSWRRPSHREEMWFMCSCNNCFSVVTVFAWEAYERGSEVHLQADPTKLELLHRSFKVKKEDFKEEQRESILEKVRLFINC